MGAGAFADNTNLSVVALRGNKPSTGTDVFKNTAATTAYVKVGATGFGNTYNGVLTVVIGSVPGSPSISTLVAGDGSATVTFVAPTASPIPAITDYRVEFIGPYDFSWSIFSHSVSASTLSYTITGLTNGTSYGVRVRAINALGSGNAGEPGDVVPAVPVTVPGAPTVSSFTAGNGSGTVTFSAPAVSGGFAITDYVVEYKTTAGSSWSTF
ncbi:MAG: fibronectin type III domain-containing protein, partial [Flavobacteriales bacterium]|nr:fibronectin type III domain-containing protein [Flavobacteriales bacterium]